MIGLHLDLKWSMYTRDFFRKIVRQCFTLGIDTILLEFENKLSIDWLKPAVHPDAWSVYGLRHFLQLCQKNHITVIPMVPLMGHMEWILQWPWWSHLQENFDRREICPCHGETSGLVSRLLDQVLTLFPNAPFVHLGGDESFSLGNCPKCKQSGKTAGQIYLDHYLPLFKQVQAAGKQPIIAGDMILANPQIIRQIPRTVIICHWDYVSGAMPGRHVWGYGPVESQKQVMKLPRFLKRFEKYLLAKDGQLFPFPYSRFLKDEGFEVILMSSARCLGDNFCAPRTWLHVRNSHTAGATAHTLGLKGLIISSWAVRFNHLETNWPAIAAGVWGYSEPQSTPEEVSERFARQFFGLDEPHLFDVFDCLGPELPDLHSHHADPYPPDIIHSYVRDLYHNPASEASKSAVQNLSRVRRSFDSGLKSLQRLQQKVTQNHDMYGHWFLAAKVLKHKADTLPILMRLAQGRNVPGQKLTLFVKDIDEQSRELRRVYSKTMPPFSLDMELRLRFGEARELATTWSGSGRVAPITDRRLGDQENRGKRNNSRFSLLEKKDEIR